ncbi:MAG TPA: gas vesicle protein [Phycisphaerae bacterium]|nr:gas vesicle protein [Phycisphaerae bacterium]
MRFRAATLADVLERVLDKGVVIAGDIKVKLVDIELLTIQIRLMIASVDKAKEMGIDWWTRDPNLCSLPGGRQKDGELADLRKRVEGLEMRTPVKRVPPPSQRKQEP